jgi:hypothetical protein
MPRGRLGRQAAERVEAASDLSALFPQGEDTSAASK